MKINTDPTFILKPSSIHDNSHTPPVKNTIITGHDDEDTGAISGKNSRSETSYQTAILTVFRNFKTNTNLIH